MGVVIVLGVLPEVLSKVPSLEGLGALIQVDDFRVDYGCLLSLFSIVVNFLEDGEDVDDVDDFLAVGLSVGLLLINEAADLAVVEVVEDLADEGVLH